MTQISGKKYQMKNAAGTENRFPYTVMEAVLGLNSYLQDQFSALADIYMPIEGITESKTGQEFVYRQSAATIKAKSLTLDRIYGKTLAWNQLVVNGDFSDGTTGWTISSATVSVSGGELTVTCTNAIAAGNITSVSGSAKTIPGHKYFYYSEYFIPDTNTSLMKIGVGPRGMYDVYQVLNSWAIARGIKTISSSNDIFIATNANYADVGDYYKLRKVMAFDLTLLYGSEIDGMTDEQILAKFESEFPGYHDFGNKLISNDASAIETVGFNLWDEEWEYGKIWGENMNSKTGVGGNYSFKNPIPVVGGESYYCKFPSGKYISGNFYDKNGNYISSFAFTDSRVITTPSNCSFIGITTYSFEPSTHDICINLSDPAKNGTYEPYRKTTLHLGLNNFKVKDGNGNITTITGGLKSAGSVRDEIVGNKYIKRVGSVDLGDLTWVLSSVGRFYYENLSTKKPGTNMIMSSAKYTLSEGNYSWSNPDKTYGANGSTPTIYIKDSAYSDAAVFKAAMSGVPLYYELATPIEYELVEPLVYSMAAGTTEERISPNADGLSAPFCCDMTYDANANNDSANAQYAATSGRLYNTHKLWGRDFDGSNDVSGALSGVTTIGASGNITTAAQLISTVATGTAPLSVASTTEVANLHSYTATKLHTQRTLWGQNFDGSGNVTGDMSSVGNISFSESGKNIASLLYFDTTNSRVGVGASSPAYKLDVNGTLNASGNTTLRGTLDVAENTAIRGTFTVGTSSVNKATTLYGALTASGAVSFSDTLTIAGLTTFNGNAILPANKIFTIGPASGAHATLEWDATNGCVKITGNLRVTGWIEQQGTQSNS